MKASDLTAAHLGKVFSVRARGVVVTGQLTLVHHEAALIEHREFARREADCIIGQVESTLRVGHVEVTVDSESEVTPAGPVS